MPVPQAGDRAYASEIRDAVPITALKTVNESTPTLSTTYQNDDALLASIDGDKTYHFECDIFYDGPANIGFKWAVPTAATMLYHRIGIDSSGASTLGATSGEGSNPTFQANAVGTIRAVRFSGTITGGGTDGTVQLQWAPVSSNASVTTVHAASSLMLWDVSS